MPISETESTSSACKMPKVTPTARASMLVAMASGSITRKATLALGWASCLRDSKIIFPPMTARSKKAIQ